MQEVKSTVENVVETTVEKTTTDVLPEFLSKGKNAIIKGTVSAGMFIVPGTLITTNLAAGLNSSTYPQSLDNARCNYYSLENFGFFDPDESSNDRSKKFKLRYSSKF